MVPGTPLIYENRSIVNLEPLSRPTRLMIDEKERIKNLPLAHEKSLVVKKERTKEKKSKKRKIKEPNSLSIKKKKVKVDEQPGVVDDIKLGTSIE